MVVKGWTLFVILLMAIFALTFVVFGQDSETDTPPEADTPVEDEDEEEVEEGVKTTINFKKVNGVWCEEVGDDCVPVQVKRIGTRPDGTPIYTMPTVMATAPMPPDGDGTLSDVRIPDFPRRAVWTPKLVDVPIIVSAPMGAPWKNKEDLEITVEASPKLKSGDFISTDTNHYMTATTKVTEVTWEYLPYNNSGSLTFTPTNGKKPTLTFSVPEDTTGRPVLSFKVTGKNVYTSASDSFKQNNLNQLRQEYVDMDQDITPEASAFDTEGAAYQATARWGLLNGGDVHSYHDHHILSFINQKARLLKQKYTGRFIFTAGYACPVENDHKTESQHIYGKALDYDAGNDEAASKRNLAIYWLGEDSLGAINSFLYDSLHTEYSSIDRDHSKKPKGFVGKLYTHGHMDWKSTTVTSGSGE